jgi:hypothetical protein
MIIIITAAAAVNKWSDACSSAAEPTISLGGVEAFAAPTAAMA